MARKFIDGVVGSFDRDAYHARRAAAAIVRERALHQIGAAGCPPNPEDANHCIDCGASLSDTGMLGSLLDTPAPATGQTTSLSTNPWSGYWDSEGRWIA